jgi:type II secretion system protein G
MKPRGFTLIELLIVVAIIAILAAIAVPNFLEAQVRSKVSRAMADMRTIGVAIESYRVDNLEYPWYPNVVDHPMRGFTPIELTTPVAYLTSLPSDPFDYNINQMYGGQRPSGEVLPIFPNPLNLFNYESRKQYATLEPYWDLYGPDYVDWFIVTSGADGWSWINEGDRFHTNGAEYLAGAPWPGEKLWYDPTNGTTSWGDIVYWGSGGGFEPPDSAFHPITY